MFGTPGSVSNREDDTAVFPPSPTMPILIVRMDPANGRCPCHPVVAHPVGVAGLDKGTIPECDLEVALKEEESHWNSWSN